MTENNLDIQQETEKSCVICPYQGNYFIYREDDVVRGRCIAAYFTMINLINNMKNKFSQKQIYLIVPRFEKISEDYCIPRFVINTYDGIQNHYPAEIEKEIYEKLLLLLAKCTLDFSLTPMAVCIRGKTVSFILPNEEQYQIAYDIFIKDSQYKLEETEWPEKSPGPITNENKLMDDLCESSALQMLQN